MFVFPFLIPPSAPPPLPPPFVLSFTVRPPIPYYKSVFILGNINNNHNHNHNHNNHNNKFEAIGTCFAISERYLMTACHNLIPGVVTYTIASSLMRERIHNNNRRNRADNRNTVINIADLTTTAYDCRKVIVTHYSNKMDYAILKDISNEPMDLKFIPISLHPIQPGRDIAVLHCPIFHFNHIYMSLLSFFIEWVTSSTPTKHHLICRGGVSKGSSGSPFVITRGAIGMYLERADGEIRYSPGNNHMTSFEAMMQSSEATEAMPSLAVTETMEIMEEEEAEDEEEGKDEEGRKEEGNKEGGGEEGRRSVGNKGNNV